MEKRLRSSLHSSVDDFLSAVVKLSLKSCKPSLKTLIHSISPSSSPSATLPRSLRRFISDSIASFQNLSQPPSSPPPPPPSPDTAKSPPSKRPRRSSRKASATSTQRNESHSSQNEPNIDHEKQRTLESVQVLAYLTFLCVSHPKKPFPAGELLPAVQLLHDNLILFESDSNLLSEIANLCEECWKEEFPGRELLISQSLPFLLSRSLTLKKKVDIHRIYVLREAFALFDFEDESIEDLKLLLIRCLIAPLYLKTEDGKKFLAFVLGLSKQVLKEALAMMKSQIPFGRKSMLEAYGEILFRAWKGVEGELKDEIEGWFMQTLIEGAIHASSGPFAASIRRVIGGFVIQRISEGVEKLLFRLAEPVIFRSLQVANSNVRLNALHLLLDLFPLEDPDSNKEAKDSLLDRQNFLLERLLVDECPGVRVVAVEGCCRVLHLFWEIIPSSTITKILTKIFDDMTHDICSEVRVSTVNGIAYLLGNPQSHEILKVLLPRLGPLISDNVVSIRVAVLDLLLAINDTRMFQFNKVVGLDALLSTLANDQSQIAQKITRLLIPSYLPSKVNREEACSRCITLIKRSPMAGARFCEFAVSEGASLKHAMELVQVLINSILSQDKAEKDQIDGILVACAHLCRSVVCEPRYQSTLKDFLSSVNAKSLFAAASTPRAQSSVIDIFSIASPEDMTGIVEDCMRLITGSCGVSQDEEMQTELRSAHKLLMSCDAFDQMFQSLTNILEKTAYRCHVKFGIEMSVEMLNGKRRKGESAVKSSAKWKHMRGKKASNFEEDYSIAVAVAWQMKELLAFEDGQKAVLGSQDLEQAFLALKDISEATISQAACYDYMDAEPVLAYMALSLHITLQSLSTGDTGDGSVSTSEKYELDQTVNHIFNCIERLLGESTDSRSDSVPDNRKADGNGKRQRGRQADVSISNSDELANSKIKRMANRVKMLTALLKFVTDSIAMDFLSHIHRRCLTFASAYLKDVISTFGQLQPSENFTTSNLSNDIFMCLKSSFSYAAKLLNHILNAATSNEASQEAFELTNTMFDLIICVELHFGPRPASSLVAAAAKPWLPDLTLALGSGTLLRKSEEEIANSSELQHIKLHFPSWLLLLAKAELHQISNRSSEEQEDNGGSSISEEPGELFPAFGRFMDMMVTLLRENRMVMDAVGMIFLTGALVGLERRDFGLVLGMLHFVCVKLVGEDREWSKLDAMLTSLPEIFPIIEREVEEEQNEEEARKELEKAKALLQPVWLYHVYETGKFCAAEE